MSALITPNGCCNQNGQIFTKYVCTCSSKPLSSLLNPCGRNCAVTAFIGSFGLTTDCACRDPTLKLVNVSLRLHLGLGILKNVSNFFHLLISDQLWLEAIILLDKECGKNVNSSKEDNCDKHFSLRTILYSKQRGAFAIKETCRNSFETLDDFWRNLPRCSSCAKWCYNTNAAWIAKRQFIIQAILQPISQINTDHSWWWATSKGLVASLGCHGNHSHVIISAGRLCSFHPDTLLSLLLQGTVPSSIILPSHQLKSAILLSLDQAKTFHLSLPVFLSPVILSLHPFSDLLFPLSQRINHFFASTTIGKSTIFLLWLEHSFAINQVSLSGYS